MNKLLIVVDYQKDFIDGSLGFVGAEDIENNIAKLINQFRDEKHDVIFTMDTHYSNYMDTVEGEKLPIVHCVKDTPGWQLPNKIQELVKDSPVFIKEKFGCKQLVSYIEEHDYDEIWICGLVSEICVFASSIVAQAASKATCKIKVCQNACGSGNKEAEKRGFEVLKYLHIEVI